MVAMDHQAQIIKAVICLVVVYVVDVMPFWYWSVGSLPDHSMDESSGLS
jgi:hypothetical protein